MWHENYSTGQKVHNSRVPFQHLNIDKTGSILVPSPFLSEQAWVQKRIQKLEGPKTNVVLEEIEHSANMMHLPHTADISSPNKAS